MPPWFIGILIMTIPVWFSHLHFFNCLSIVANASGLFIINSPFKWITGASRLSKIRKIWQIGQANVGVIYTAVGGLDFSEWTGNWPKKPCGYPLWGFLVQPLSKSFSHNMWYVNRKFSQSLEFLGIWLPIPWKDYGSRMQRWVCVFHYSFIRRGYS